MAANVELVVRQIVENSGAIQKAAKDLDGLDKAGKKSGSQIDRLKQNWQKLTVGLAAAAGAIYTVKKAFDFAQEGASLNQLRDSFDGLNQRVLKTPNLLDDMKRAARGTLTETQIMAGVLKLTAGVSDDVAQSLAKASPQLLEVAKAAQKLNPSLGDTAFLYDSIATGIKRSSPLILDNLGIIVKVGEANEEYAASLGKTVEQLTAEEKQIALLNAVLKTGENLIRQAGGSTESATDAYARFTTNLAEGTEELKRAAADGLRPWIGLLADMSEQADDSGGALRELAADVAFFGDALVGIKRAAEETTGDLDGVEGALSGIDKTIRNFSASPFFAVLSAVVDFGQEIGDAAGGIDRFFGELDQDQGFIAFNLAIARLLDDLPIFNKLLGENREKWEDAAAATGTTTAAADAWTQRAIAMNIQWAEFAKTTDTEVAPALEYTKEQLEEIMSVSAGADKNMLKYSAAAQQAAKRGVELKLAADATDALAEATARLAGFARQAITGGLSLFNQELDELGPKMVVIGGRTADQNRLLGEAQSEYRKLGREIADIAAAPELFGLSAEEAAKKTEELLARQGELVPLMGRLGEVTGTAALATVEATVNQEALTEAFFNSVVAAGSTAEQMVGLGLALGTLNEQQADAILKQAMMMEQIRLLTEAYVNNNLTAEQARKAILGIGSGALDTIADIEKLIQAAKDSRAAFEEWAQTYTATVIVDQQYRGGTVVDVPVDHISGPGTSGHRQHGGMMVPGQTYMVGEAGPEMMRVAYPSMVYPSGTGDSGGQQISISIDARGAQHGVANEIAKAVRRELDAQGARSAGLRRRGGVT